MGRGPEAALVEEVSGGGGTLESCGDVPMEFFGRGQLREKARWGCSWAMARKGRMMPRMVVVVVVVAAIRSAVAIAGDVCRRWSFLFYSFFLPSFFPSFLPSCLPSFLPSFLSSFLPFFLPSYLPSLQTCSGCRWAARLQLGGGGGSGGGTDAVQDVLTQHKRKKSSDVGTPWQTGG